MQYREHIVFRCAVDPCLVISEVGQVELLLLAPVQPKKLANLWDRNSRCLSSGRSQRLLLMCLARADES